MMTLQRAIEQYIEDFLILEKGLSAASVGAYKTDLRQYFDFMTELKIESVSEIKLEDIEKFISDLNEKKYAVSSVARKISAVKTFHKFCNAEGLSDSDPTEFLHSHRQLRKLPKVIPSESIDKLMEMPLDSTPSGIRDRAMLEVLYGCGLRISELTNLTLTQLHLSDEILRIVGKGNKTRFVPIGSKALYALKRYLELGRPDFRKTNADDRGVVFLNRFGKPLGRVGAYGIITDYLERTFPGKNYTPHTLRHSFATHIIEGGGDIRTVQELLGHASIATTQIYTHLDSVYLRNVMQKFHPRG